MTPYFSDGQVSLYLGDCREVLPAPGLHADVMVTDPPYDAALEWWGDRPALVFGSWRRPRPAATRAVLVWDKGDGVGMGDLSIPWKPNWEEVYVLGSGFSGPRTSGVLRGHRVASWSSGGRRLHPNEKPVSLLHELIGKCPPGLVLDPFAGSGSTLVAARNLGRAAVGVELDERWAEVAASRLSQRDLFGVEPVAPVLSQGVLLDSD